MLWLQLWSKCVQGINRKPENTPYSQHSDTLSLVSHRRTHTDAVTSNLSFKIHWGQSDNTQSICSTLSFAFHASRLFFEVAILWCSQRDTLSLFQFPWQRNAALWKAAESWCDTVLVYTDTWNGNGIYTPCLQFCLRHVFALVGECEQIEKRLKNRCRLVKITHSMDKIFVWLREMLF